MDFRYALSEIRKHSTDVWWWRKRFLSHVVSRYYKLNSPDAVPLVDLDWDNVLLLDACRYDLFEDMLAEYELPGTPEKRRSVGSATPEYLEKNFAGRQFHDTVYVTANPYVNTKLPDNTFHHVVSVWKDGWDETLQTVTPEVMRDATLRAAEEFPEKRLIVHFDQPHAPFIGEVTLDGRKVSAIRHVALGEDRPDPDERIPRPFDQLREGTRTYEEVYEGYRSNLARVLPVVETLLEFLEGMTAVTSDHGNALGEYASPFPIRIYGHPIGILIPALIEVPWHTHQNGERKRTVAEKPEKVPADDKVNESAERRLRQLGYAE